jgi:iron-sulfur cluster insertion protein
MVTVTDTAKKQALRLMEDDGKDGFFIRVGVEGGGCSGFQYGFTFDEDKNEDDFDLEFDGVVVLIDSISAQYLQGAKIEYTEDAMGATFAIKNPNAQTTCGCGSSFSI